MKNLKRTLCLVLCLVMAIGLLATGASAAFKDDSTITYKEAVSLLSGLGVINGYEDNTFRPTENFNRAGLAKMVAFFAWGGTDFSNYYGGASVFADTEKYAWAQGSINFGYNAGYISGAGVNADNKLVFNPAGTVKGSELAKTLLCLLGYKADSKNPTYALTGANWELNSIRLAQQEGLFAGLKEGFDPTAALTREAAAQIFANLLAKGYTYNYVVLTDSYNKDDDTDVFEKYFTNWAKNPGATADSFGRPIIAYTNSSAASKNFEVAAKANLTYTTTVTEATVYADLGLTGTITDGADGWAIKLRDNGAVAAVQTIRYNNATAIPGSGNGVLTEVYYNASAKTLTIVLVDTYFGIVKSVAPATPLAKETATITVGGADKTLVIAGLKAKDTVLVTMIDNGALQSAEKVAPTALTATSYVADVSFVAGGTTYKYSANVVGKVSTFTAYDVYLDNYGYVINAAGQQATPDYAVVLSANTLTATWPATGSTYQVQLLKVDGTVEIATATTAAAALGTDLGTITAGEYKVGDIVTYTAGTGADAGKLVVTQIAETSVGEVATTNSAAITKGTVAFTADGGTKLANAKTIFLVKTVKDNVASYASYTGIANVPSITSSTDSVVYTPATATYAAVVYVDTAVLTTAPTVADTVVYVDASSKVTANDATKGEYSIYNAVVDGKVTTIETTKDLISADGIYGKVTTNDKGLISAVDALSGAGIALVTTAVTGTTAAADGVVVLGSANLTYTDATQVYMVTDTGITVSSVGAITTDATDKVIYYTTGGVLTAAYITVVNP